VITTQIEQQLTILLRRTQRIHLATAHGDVEIDRSGYGIMCRLLDDGPQRLGALAHSFGLDPSTITRQVQSLEQSGWVARRADPSDRRASLLDVTPDGRDVLTETRERRRRWLRHALVDWPEHDLVEFGRLLEQFNGSIDRLNLPWEPATNDGQVAAATPDG
jgi:DNA-binding MarR family transcriptional regulator